MSDDIQTKAELQYSQLRDWYLARLRRNALEQAKSTELTPLALIQKDQLLVKELGARTANAPTTQATKKKRIPVLSYGLLVAAWVILAVLSMFGQADVPQMISMIYRMTMGAFFGDTADQSMSFIPAWLVGTLAALFFASATLLMLYARGDETSSQ